MVLHWLPPLPSAAIEAWFDRVLELFLPAVDQLQQLPEKAAALWGLPPVNQEDAALLTSEAGERVVRAFTAKILAEPGALTPQRFKELMNEVKAETGVKGKDLFHPVRIILTGAHSGPEFDKLIPLLEDGSRLDLPTHVSSVRERVEAFLASSAGNDRFHLCSRVAGGGPRLPAVDPAPARQFVYPAQVEEVERGALEVMIRPPDHAGPFLATCALGFAGLRRAHRRVGLS